MERIELYFGEVGLETINKYTRNKQQHGSGISFSDISWRSPNLGKVRIYSSKSDLEIDNLSWLQGYAFRKGFGLQAIDITSNLSSVEYTTQEEAYQAYVTLMQQLQAKGWRQFFLPFSERLHPKDNFKYLESMHKVIDPNYILTFKEWKAQFSKSKYLYLNLQSGDIRLDISIYLSGFNDGKVRYQVDYSFETKQYYNMNMMKGYDNLTYDEKKVLFLEKKESDKAGRQRSEANVISEGYIIDEAYVDDIYDYKPY